MPDDRLGAFSLPTVLVICVLMALILFSAITFADLDRQSYALYHRQKQQILDHIEIKRKAGFLTKERIAARPIGGFGMNQHHNLFGSAESTSQLNAELADMKVKNTVLGQDSKNVKVQPAEAGNIHLA